MTANLDIRAYDGDHYYMWDAQQQFWYGYEWTRNLASGVGQPTVNNDVSPNYPQSNSDLRYYNESFPASGISNPAIHAAFKDLPNANEMSWYAIYGDPRWDADKLWATMGHLYKGGMWFKKKAVLQAESHYDTEKSADGSTDLRTTYKDYDNNSSSINSGVPSATDANNYFYLPALGTYNNTGLLYNVGSRGYYWSSSAYPWLIGNAYHLYFTSDGVSVPRNYRAYGDRAQKFSDFGDN